ncbi:hypothetical protein F4775DRAFT_594633 [Biscogniauxia sp. FL1348]|nr:hypothetical protein F4775DRAFT_594633 [Biscogniauxia sp. FL1348]
MPCFHFFSSPPAYHSVKMLVSVFTTFVVLLLGQASAQTTTASPCAVGCVDGAFANTASLGCAVGDRLCMCGKSVSLLDGIRDCVNQACTSEAATQLSLAEQYGNDICAAISATAGQTPTTPATTPAADLTTAETPATTPSPTTAAATPETTEAQSPSPSPTPAESSTQGTTSPVSADNVQSTTGSTTTNPTSTGTVSETSESSTQSPTSTSGPVTLSDSTASGTSGAAATGTTAASNEDGNGSTSSSSELPTAVKAGIGAGAGVAVVMIAIIALCLCMRRRKQKEAARRAAAAHSLKISEPLPGSGRQRSEDVCGNTIEYLSDVAYIPVFAIERFLFVPARHAH